MSRKGVVVRLYLLTHINWTDHYNVYQHHLTSFLITRAGLPPISEFSISKRPLTTESAATTHPSGITVLYKF